MYAYRYDMFSFPPNLVYSVSCGSLMVMLELAFFGKKIQKKLTNHLLRSDLFELNKISSGNHVSRIMNDVVLIKEGFERSINNLIRDTLTIIALMSYLIWLDWLLSISAPLGNVALDTRDS